MADTKVDVSMEELLEQFGINGKRLEDPTANVKDLVREVVIRMDALRDADRRYIEAELKHVNAQAELRAFFAEKLEIAEAKRIDAIRGVDVAAVGIANERATAQAAVLAAQVQTSAETLRVQLQQTAAIFKTQLDQTTQQLSDRISSVERTQYENRSSAGNISPALAEQLSQLAAQVSNLKESRDRGEGKSGISTAMLIAVAVAVTGFISFILQRLMTGGL